ncbi:MAG: Uma2 family endonuclease [Myxococcota bacterium]
MEPARAMSLEEYLTLDAESDTRHEYLNGVVTAMAGASPRHNLITANVTASLGAALRDGPCRVLDSGQRIRIEALGAPQGGLR